jgi:hypothetical protein
VSAATRIRQSFLFAQGDMPPQDAPFEVSLSEGENVVLAYWIGSAAMMFENCWRSIDAGDHDEDPDFVDYVKAFCPRGAPALAVAAINKISAGGGRAVLDCGELCVLAVMAQVRAYARAPEEEIESMLVKIFTRVREQMIEDTAARAAL